MKIAICSLSELTYVSEFIDAAVALKRQHEVRYFLGYPSTASIALLERRDISYEISLAVKPELTHPDSAPSTFDLFSSFFFRQAELVLPHLVGQMEGWGAEIVLSHLRDFAGINAAEILEIPVVSFGSHTNPQRNEELDPPFGSGLSRTASVAQRTFMWRLHHDYHLKLDEEYNRRLRKPYGLAPIENASTHTSDRMILLSIIESLGIATSPQVHFVGPLCSRTGETPDQEETERIQTLRQSPRPRVFLSLGATYGSTLKNDCIAAMEGYEGTVVSGYYRDVASVIEASDAVVSVCGGKTVMDALACGKPIIGLPQQGEQKEIALALAEQGAAILPCLRKWDSAAFLSAVRELCRNPVYQEAAKSLQRIVKETGRANEVERLLSQLHFSR